MRICGHLDAVHILDISRHLVEAHTLLHICAQADMVCHGREAYVQHLEALEALERLDLVVEEDQPHEEEEETATVYERVGHAARAHLAREGVGLGSG